jgi:hypothetical protein
MAARRQHPEAKYGQLLERATARSANENAHAEGWRAPTGWLVTIVKLDGARVRHEVSSYAAGVALRRQILADDPGADCGWVIQLPVPIDTRADGSRRGGPSPERAHVLETECD